MYTHIVHYRTYKDPYHAEIKESIFTYFDNAKDALTFFNGLKSRGIDCCNRSITGTNYVGTQDIPDKCHECEYHSYGYCNSPKRYECQKVIWVDDCTRWIDSDGKYGDIYINDNSP